MPNVKVDTLPKVLEADTVYVVKETGITVTDSSGAIAMNLQGAYYSNAYADCTNFDEVAALLANESPNEYGGSGLSMPTPLPPPPVNLLDFYKEAQEGYYEFTTVVPNNQYVFVPFPKPFSKKPDIFLMTLDVKDVTVRVSYMGEVTAEGFYVGLNYGASLKGVYYHAAVSK